MKRENLPGGFERIQYADYDGYVYHQAIKLERHLESIAKIDQTHQQRLFNMLLNDQIIGPGMSVLCLGARLGGEVKAFCQRGCFAVGIDLNPGVNNQFVMHGDFHNLQWYGNCVDAVYTNSLDHVRDLDMVIRGIYEVLKPDGIFLLEAVAGSEEEGHRRDPYDCFTWPTIDALLENFAGFEIIKRQSVSEHWSGEAIYMRKIA